MRIARLWRLEHTCARRFDNHSLLFCFDNHRLLLRSGVAERPAMDHKADEYWGTLLLATAQDARREGDLVTAELLFAEAMRYFEEADRLASRWRSFEARLDDMASRRL